MIVRRGVNMQFAFSSPSGRGRSLGAGKPALVAGADYSVKRAGEGCQPLAGGLLGIEQILPLPNGQPSPARLSAAQAHDLSQRER